MRKTYVSAHKETTSCSSTNTQKQKIAFYKDVMRYCQYEDKLLGTNITCTLMLFKKGALFSFHFVHPEDCEWTFVIYEAHTRKPFY